MDTYHDLPKGIEDRITLFPTWFTVGFGVTLTIFMTYVGIARPVTRELAQLRQQVGALELHIAQLSGHTEAAGETAALLGSLSSQSAQIQLARTALQDLRDLQQHLIVESRQTQAALSAAAQLGALKDTLIANSTRAVDAANVVALSERIYDRLANAAESSYEALEVGQSLMGLSEELVLRGQDIESATSALRAMVDLGETLRRENDNVHVARERVADLLNLKDAIVAQTENLADAITTLELTADLRAQFDQAQGAFADIRHWLVEIVASEQLLQRARYALEPITDLVNLRRLKPEELRDVARSVVEQFQTKVAARASGNYQPKLAPPVAAGGDADDLAPLRMQ